MQKDIKREKTLAKNNTFGLDEVLVQQSPKIATA